jgi:hypothetical protein
MTTESNYWDRNIPHSIIPVKEISDSGKFLGLSWVHYSMHKVDHTSWSDGRDDSWNYGTSLRADYNHGSNGGHPAITRNSS